MKSINFGVDWLIEKSMILVDVDHEGENGDVGAVVWIDQSGIEKIDLWLKIMALIGYHGKIGLLSIFPLE